MQTTQNNITLQTRKRSKDIRAKNLLKLGFIPAVLYSHGKTQHIEVAKKDMLHLFSQGISESTLISLDLGKTQETAFIKDYEVHPITSEIIHIDFYKVTFGEKVRTHISLKLIGKPPGVKEGGVLETFLSELEVEMLPKDLVAYIEVDISSLNIGDAIHIRDIILPSDTKLFLNNDVTVCHISVSAKLESEAVSVENEDELQDGS